MKNFYIGIDSGGTNCRVGFGDGTGRIIHSANYESLHYSQAGADAFSERISRILDEFCSEINLNLSSVSGICLGAAGARHESDKARIQEILSDSMGFRNVRVESDTAVAYYSAFREGDGLLLISGTGSILFGKHEGNNVRIGGWGKLLGDEGSSYSISLGMLKSLVLHFDESDVPCGLETEIKKEFGLTRENILEEIYHRNFNIHTLAPFAIRMAEEGDEICLQTLNEEIEGLLRLLRTFAGKYPSAECTGVALMGSVIENDNYFSRIVKKRISEEFGKLFDVREEKINTLKGALKIAVKTFAE